MEVRSSAGRIPPQLVAEHANMKLTKMAMDTVEARAAALLQAIDEAHQSMETFRDPLVGTKIDVRG